MREKSYRKKINKGEEIINEIVQENAPALAGVAQWIERRQ